MSETAQKRQKHPFGLWIGIALIGFGLLAVINGASSLLDNKQRLIAPKGILTVEVVDTPEARAKGLSGREQLGKNEGMLFVFDGESQEHCIWMKDMRFSIDVAWLDANKKVVSLKENLAPETYPESFCPEVPAQYIIELPAGRASELDIVRNNTIRF